MQLLFSAAGIVAIFLCAYALSTNRQAIRWRTVCGAFGLQFALAAFVLYLPWGQSLLGKMSQGVSTIIGFANEGIGFVFGPLADSGAVGFVFAVKVLPLIIFISALISLLYYLGVMGVVIRVIGGGLERLLGTTRAESLVATSNIFLSQGESPLVVRPFLASMTRSELFAVMVGGMASVAGSVLGGYAAMGVDLKYLIAASFMAAPGGLLMAKIMVPETQQPVDQSEIDLSGSEQSNAIDALASGAMNGMKVAVAVGTMLIAFISVIAMVNHGLDLLGQELEIQGLSLQRLFGYLFAPLAFVTGVPMDEVMAVGSLLGQKIAMNEFVAFMDFATVKDTLSAHSQIIVVFALCGFANIGSIAIQLGSIGAMVPERRKDVASLGIRAVIAATFANLMSASLAGFFTQLSL
ncbi:NupC/NupG family nucleoside CNT transporter [Photobacterium sp. 1_MG-2023]|uniref:NupC/NupG family nucleoside CNT transporter n=1 Tax=Photobacterium sp. 1_MG-2023 TaxID=3062646 RepID=UPI0026E124DA|nr:NupC/NupG family nucleoside CNT transporter [Photobacterium sp. 1_MG-2023]MDO6704865.1 NupC/NupG family nucleoside CNT transporter [Photobacterium sp. 1_MG-2023]